MAKRGYPAKPSWSGPRSAPEAGSDADPDDPAVLWGRRVGRALAIMALVLFGLYLVTHLLR
jgi:hypothetical protein